MAVNSHLRALSDERRMLEWVASGFSNRCGCGDCTEGRGRSYVVEEAEAHRAAALCMVPRRPHNSHGALHTPTKHLLHRLPASRQRSCGWRSR